jgi:hypothetical protein
MGVEVVRGRDSIMDLERLKALLERKGLRRWGGGVNDEKAVYS